MLKLKNYLFILLILSLALGFYSRSNAQPIEDTDALKYTIQYDNAGPHPSLNVTLEFTGNETGHNLLILPTATETGGSYKNFHNISATNATLHKTPTANIYALHYIPGSDIIIRYQVRQGEASGPLGNFRQFLEPQIQNDYFQFKGDGVFLYPQIYSTEKPIAISLNWNLPNGWPIANSFGANNLHQQFTTTIIDLLESLFLAGNYHLYQTQVQGGTIWTAIRGRWTFTDQQYNAAVVKLLSTERAFWQDYRFPNYLVSLMPMGTGCNTGGGTGVNNAFASFMGPQCILSKDALFLITHENFHAWNRPFIFKYLTEDNDKSFYWFSEGFTNYYAHLLTLRAGLISIQDYIDQYNKTLVNYYFSPARTTPVQVVQEDFWKDYNIQQLPYLQGEILAQNWNAQLKHATKGEKSLDNLMRAIINPTNPEQSAVDVHKLNNFLQQFMSYDANTDINAIHAGKIIQPAIDSFGPCYRLEIKMTAPYKPGFNIDPSKQSGVVTSVDPKSRAYAAGLRDGQKLISVQYNINDVTQPIIVTVVDNGVQKVIRYLPYVEKLRPVPQFIRNDKAWQDDPKACEDWFND